MTIWEAEGILVDSVNKFWIPRALDMFRSMVDSRTTVSNLVISKDWPSKGQISFTRDADGKKVTLKLVGNKFLGKSR